MPNNPNIPKYHELMNPLLKALHDLGGSGSINEIYDKIVEALDLEEEILNIPHNPDKSSQTEIEYRLAWARTYLKKYGLIENSVRGIWLIKPDKRDTKSIDPQVVVKSVRAKHRKKKIQDKGEDNGEQESQPWREKLHHVLTKEIEPDAFERLAKRILRESGFIQVEVTGRSGDGGIDGKGIVRLSGLLSFHIVFQCKRYQGSVSSSSIRDFRGAMVGRADKGLFITTGSFTRDAIKEATRDGAPPIDLVDGEQLADTLKELQLGVKTEMVENVAVDEEWFKSV